MRRPHEGERDGAANRAACGPDARAGRGRPGGAAGRDAFGLRPLRQLPVVEPGSNRRLSQRRPAATVRSRSVNRSGLLIALALAAAVGLPFGVFPRLDLDLAGLFFDPAADGFWGRVDPVLNGLREASRLLITLLVAPAVLALIGKLVLPRRPMLIPGRAAVLMVATLALGPGIVTNSILKDHWGRSRPIDVMAFGGDEHFVPWWDP